MNANHVKRNLPYIFMAIPAVSIFSVFFIIPLIFTTKYSFYNWTNFSPDIVFSGLKNYKQLLADGIILKGLKNTRSIKHLGCWISLEIYPVCKWLWFDKPGAFETGIWKNQLSRKWKNRYIFHNCNFSVAVVWMVYGNLHRKFAKY